MLRKIQKAIHNRKPDQRGFTLIEMIVSVGIFTVTVAIIVGSLVSIMDASRKARAMRVVMDNLNAAIENMARGIRVGRTYHCGDSGSGTYGTPDSCSFLSGGDSFIAFEPAAGNSADDSDQVIYRLNGTTIERSTDGGTTYLDLTAPEITVNELTFYVSQAKPILGTRFQPRVTIVLRGVAGADDNVITEFNIQTTISQRTPNLPTN